MDTLSEPLIVLAPSRPRLRALPCPWRAPDANDPAHCIEIVCILSIEPILPIYASTFAGSNENWYRQTAASFLMGLICPSRVVAPSAVRNTEAGRRMLARG